MEEKMIDGSGSCNCCVCCGKEIPEGRMVCKDCETENMKEEDTD